MDALASLGAAYACAACALALARARFPSAWARLGVRVTPVSVFASTSAGTSRVLALGRRHASALAAWFAAGAWACAAGWVCAVALLGYNAARFVGSLLYGRADDAGEEPFVGVAIPGVTMPWDQAGYLWLAVAVSVGFHEFGHALAAASLGVRTLRVGFFSLLCFPGAFVELEGQGGGGDDCDGGDSAYARLRPLERARIAAAGVWHNVVLCAAAAVAVQALPLALRPAFAAARGGGAAVVEVWAPGAAAVLAAGDTVLAVDGSAVKGTAGWAEAMGTLASPAWSDGQGGGFCVPRDEAEALLVANGHGCCDPDFGGNLTCFEASGDLHFCAGALALLAPLDHRRDGPGRCDTAAGGGVCSPLGGRARLCAVVRDLGPGERVVAFDVARRLGGAAERALFAGHPAEPLLGVRVSDLEVREPLAGLVPASLPLVLDRALRYTGMVSASLALLNSAPVFYADGAIFTALVSEWWHGPRAPAPSVAPVLAAGTGLLLLNLAATAADAVLP